MALNLQKQDRQHYSAFQCSRETLMAKIMTLSQDSLQQTNAFVDNLLKPHAIGVQLKLHDNRCSFSTCYCDIHFKMSDGSLVPFHVKSRQAMLLFAFLLLHPQGVRRNVLLTGCEELRVLFSKMYRLPKDHVPSFFDRRLDRPGRPLDQALTNARRAVRMALGNDELCNNFIIDSKNPSMRNTLFIPFVQKDGTVETINF